MEKNSSLNKIRLDTYLAQQGLVSSRSRAQALILAGTVYVNDQHATGVAQRVTDSDRVEIRGPDHPYVGRGGVKLAHALKAFSLDVTDQVALDIGASTGGFTDCLLQAGARRVYAVDVGYGQLAWRLRQDDRVVVIERTNVRDWRGDEIDAAPDFFTVDVSFISLKKVIPALQKILDTKGAAEQTGVLLIKPQFEAARQEIGSGGVVRDPEIIARIVAELQHFLLSQGWQLVGVVPSPLRGTKGNQEQLLAVRRSL